MKRSVRIGGLLVACICVPLVSTAQSQQPNYSVSVRELSIPAKALHQFEQGMERLAKNDIEGSLPHFQRAVAEYAGYYEAYDRIGAAELKLFRIPEAEQAFRKSIEVSGGQYAHPLIALGAILDGREQFAEAESVTLKGLGIDPESWTGHYYLALAQFGLNRLAEAEQSLREALHWKAEFPQAHLMLAEIHGREKDYRSLVGDLDEYLRLSPDGPTSGRARVVRDSAAGMLKGSKTNTVPANPQP
jgi:tetratricopeptide (TPR) repeat protein